MDGKISVEEYLQNKQLLELTYVPYGQRVEICREILNQCTNVFNNYSTIDSVLLNRVKNEIFIGAVTNLDFSIENNDGLDGYDQLCYEDELYDLIETCGYLYGQFDEILDLMLQDYYHNEGSLRSYFHNLKQSITTYIALERDSISSFIQGLDTKKIVDNLTKMMDRK